MPCTTCRIWITSTTKRTFLAPLHADLLPTWPALPQPHAAGWLGKQAAACLCASSKNTYVAVHNSVRPLQPCTAQWLLGIIAPMPWAMARKHAHQNGRAMQALLCAANDRALHDWAHDTAAIGLIHCAHIGCCVDMHPLSSHMTKASAGPPEHASAVSAVASRRKKQKKGVHSCTNNRGGQWGPTAALRAGMAKGLQLQLQTNSKELAKAYKGIWHNGCQLAAGQSGVGGGAGRHTGASSDKRAARWGRERKRGTHRHGIRTHHACTTRQGRAGARQACVAGAGRLGVI